MHIIDVPVLTVPWGTVTDLRLVSPGRYVTGEPAFVLMKGTEVYTTVSVNLPNSPPSPDTFWIKDYSEHQGLADALVAAGVVVLTGRLVGVGFGTAIEVRLADGLVWPSFPGDPS